MLLDLNFALKRPHTYFDLDFRDFFFIKEANNAGFPTQISSAFINQGAYTVKVI